MDLTYTKPHLIPMLFEALPRVSVRGRFPAQARGIWESKPTPTFIETVFSPPRRCLLGSFFLHRHMKNETDTSDKVWFLQIFNNLVSVCLFAEPVQEKCPCETLWSLKAVIALIFWLSPHRRVSVRFHFPAQGRRKCKQTPPKTFFSYRLSYWILTLFGGVC